MSARVARATRSIRRAFLVLFCILCLKPSATHPEKRWKLHHTMQYRALWIEYRLLNVKGAGVDIWAHLIEYRALLVECRALLIE